MEAKKAFEQIFGFSLESEPEIRVAMTRAEISPGEGFVEEVMRLMIMREAKRSDIKGFVAYGDPQSGELKIVDPNNGSSFLLDW